MNGDASHPPPTAPAGFGWSRQRLLWIIAFALATHIALIFIFGTKKPVLPRPVLNVPELQFARGSSEALALDDPTLFALPHARDFSTPIWTAVPVPPPVSFRWTEPPRFLAPAAETFGTVFAAFMQTNPAPVVTLNFKPEPRFLPPVSPLPSLLPAGSTLNVTGDLAGRPLLFQPAVPDVPYTDVLLPSKVQALVDPSGTVLSVVLRDSSSLDAADALAIALAEQLRFAPARQLAFGDIIFHWHTVPLAVTNNPATHP